MVFGTRSQRLPKEFAPFSTDWDIVDTGFSPAHQPIFVEFPLLIAVCAEPVAGIVVPFILKAHSDAVLMEGPKFLDQPVVEFFRPFAAQEGNDCLASLKELSAIAPATVFGIGRCDAFGIAMS